LVVVCGSQQCRFLTIRDGHVFVDVQNLDHLPVKAPDPGAPIKGYRVTSQTSCVTGHSQKPATSNPPPASSFAFIPLIREVRLAATNASRAAVCQ
jgi:hypothetical protein